MTNIQTGQRDPTLCQVTVATDCLLPVGHQHPHLFPNPLQEENQTLRLEVESYRQRALDAEATLQRVKKALQDPSL